MSTDSSIIECECGSRIRLPAGKRSRSLRCPKCKQPLALTADALVLSSKPLSSGQKPVCPICQTAIEAEERCVDCPGCDQVHHNECWSEVGGCGTYGCAESPTVEASDSPQTPLTAWGDTKNCPACGEEIKSIALRCRYCSTEFSSVDPMSVADLRKHARVSDRTETFQKVVVGIFVFSIIGCLAPLMVLISMAYLLPRRDQLSKCGPVFVIMGWTSIVLSALYSVMLIMFFLTGEL